jgi:hypothetical protein
MRNGNPRGESPHANDSTSEGFVDYVLKKTTNRIDGLAIDPITGPLPSRMNCLPLPFRGVRLL